MGSSSYSANEHRPSSTYIRLRPTLFPTVATTRHLVTPPQPQPHPSVTIVTYSTIRSCEKKITTKPNDETHRPSLFPRLALGSPHDALCTHAWERTLTRSQIAAIKENPAGGRGKRPTSRRCRRRRRHCRRLRIRKKRDDREGKPWVAALRPCMRAQRNRTESNQLELIKLKPKPTEERAVATDRPTS